MSTTKALILIGGSSKRMGSDKYLMGPNGKPQYQHLYEMTTGLGLETYLSCSQEQSSSLAHQMNQIIDVQEGIGPMGGLYSAIQQDDKCSWLVIACDLINLDTDTISQLLREPHGEEGVATLKREDSAFYETTITLYRPACFDIVRELVNQDIYSLQQALKKTQVKTLKPLNLSVLCNANTPDDLLSS